MELITMAKPMKLTVKDWSAIAIFTGLVTVATIALKVDIPQTKGYFNLGDSMVYITAILFGPLVGGVAGGVGSMLGDIILGAFPYPPGTLVVKGIEGLIVGYISHKSNPLEKWQRAWRLVTVVLGIVLAFLIYELGSIYYSVEWQFTPLGVYIGSFQFNTTFWIVVAFLLEALIIYVGVGLDPKVVWQGLAILIGGVEMIIGYFLYEYYALAYGPAALSEVPFNIGQAVVGLAVAIPVAKAIKRQFK
jgi:uncharacterized membrane protein